MAASTGRRASASTWQRYRRIADNSSDVVYETTPDGVIQWIQPTVESLLGWTPQQLRGTQVRDLVHPDDLAMVNQSRRTVYGGAELDEVPCRFRTADGTYRTCTVRARPVRDLDGEIIGAVMALRDSHLQAAALRALTTLSQGNSVLVGARDEQSLLDEMCRTVADAGGYELVWYARKIHDAQHTVAQVAIGGPRADVMADVSTTWDPDTTSVGIAGPALREGVTHLINGLDSDPRTAAWHEVAQRTGLRSGIGLPVRVNGEVDGALIVCSADLGVFDDLAQHLLEDLAASIGYGLERIRIDQTLDRARLESDEQSLRLRGILDAMLDPLVVLESVRDPDGTLVDFRYIEANVAALAYDGLDYGQLIGRRFLEVHPGLTGTDAFALYAACADGAGPVALDDYSYANPLIGGSTARYDIRAARIGDAIALTWRDVTARYHEQQKLAASEQRYRTLIQHMSDVVWETREDGSMGWVSESVTRVLGWDPAEIVGRPTVELVHLEDRDRAARHIASVRLGLTIHDEFRMRSRDGSHRWFSVTARRSTAATPPVNVVVLRDIDAEVVGRALLEQAVRHDPLTGLVTRAVASSHLDELLARHDGAVLGVLKIGVDSLARINESLGHAAGDVVLAAVASRVSAAVDDVDTAFVARGSGDEIIVVATGLASGADAGALADRIRDEVRRPVETDGHALVPTVSIGVATTETGISATAETLLGAAGLAMRESKKLSGDRTEFVDAALAAAASLRLTLETELRDAIPAGELHPWFQPVVSLADGTTVGYEALVRWTRPDGSVREPAAFLPAAERSALIVDLDRSVLEQSVERLRSLPGDQHVAVNVSAASLVRDDYVAFVEERIVSSGVRPNRLVLEITETALLQGLTQVRSAMERLASIGVRWYVDDFGTGYSSIAHLRDLPVAGLKLDRSFVVGIGEGDATCIRLAQALAGLAHGLELDTVAEGVETAEQAAYLRSQGWVHGQGWLYGKAAPLA